MDRTGFIKGVVADDYDNDGYVDLYLSDFNGDNLLYHNNHDRTFTEVGKQSRACRRRVAASPPGSSTTTTTAGPICCVNSYYLSIDEVVASYIGLPRNAETLKLYQQPRKRHVPRCQRRRRDSIRCFMPMAANFGDVNNDGYLDMYLGMGSPSFASMFPHELLLNQGGKSFVSITASSGHRRAAQGPRHRHSPISTATATRTSSPKSAAPCRPTAMRLRLFENPGKRNDWINIRLVGVKTNRPAIGSEELRSPWRTPVQAGRRRQRAVDSYATVGSARVPSGPIRVELARRPGAFGAYQEGRGLVCPPATRFQRFSDVGKNQFPRRSAGFAERYTKLERKAVRLVRRDQREAGRAGEAGRGQEGYLPSSPPAFPVRLRARPVPSTIVTLLIDRHVCQSVRSCGSGQPGDFSQSSFVARPRPSTSARIVRRQDSSRPPSSTLDLRDPASRPGDARADGVAIAVDALQFHTDPVVVGAPRCCRKSRGASPLHATSASTTAVVVEIAHGQTTRRERLREHRPGIRRLMFRRRLAVVPERAGAVPAISRPARAARSVSSGWPLASSRDRRGRRCRYRRTSDPQPLSSRVASATPCSRETSAKKLARLVPVE